MLFRQRTLTTSEREWFWMKKLFSRRPSAGLIVGFVALCVALGGGAYAATSKKIEYKGLSKDGRLKVLGVASTNANVSNTPNVPGPPCDPNSAGEYKDCTSVKVNGSTGFPRRYFVVFDGVLNGTGSPASGECRLELDNQVLDGSTNKIHTEGPDVSIGTNIVTTPQGGKHEISIACNETAGDVKLPTYQLSATQVR
jgi:hypothetical protein